MRLQGADMAKFNEFKFKYLDSTVQNNGVCRVVKKRMQAGRCGWRRVTGVICDRWMPAGMKKLKTVVRPATVYGMKMVPMTKKTTELKMCFP